MMDALNNHDFCVAIAGVSFFVLGFAWGWLYRGMR